MNAIILAAGLGSRFGEMTAENHKALLSVGGLPNIERTIGFLYARGVQEITVVTGHMSHLFEYLADKYRIKLIYNEHYADYNNIYSMYLALPDLSDTLVIDADVVLLDNPFVQSATSLYYVIQRSNQGVEWIPCIDEQGFVENMEISDAAKPSMLGISYWTAADCAVIKAAFRDYLTKETLSNPKLYWDNIILPLYDKLQIKTLLVSSEVAGEMDTQEEYEQLCRLAAEK